MKSVSKVSNHLGYWTDIPVLFHLVRGHTVLVNTEIGVIPAPYAALAGLEMLNMTH